MNENEKVTEMGALHYARKDRTTIPQPSTIDASVFGGDLELENRTLRARIADLDGQLQTARASRLIAPHEEEAIAEQARAFGAANSEQNKITKFIRDNFATEMARGDFAGDSFPQMVIRLMERARRPWWRRVLGA